MNLSFMSSHFAIASAPLGSFCSYCVDIVFSTAHKSKGLEFDTVKLTNDYVDFEDDDTHSTLIGTCVYIHCM